MKVMTRCLLPRHYQIESSWLRAISSFIFFLLLFTGCATAPPASKNSDWARQQDQLHNLDSWQFRGRVDVRYNNESHTPRIKWMQQNVKYNIRLWGTFNAGNTEIVGRPGFVTMESGSEVLTANSPEELILQQLGYELPVSYLEFWIKGLPAPQSEADLSFNELSQLTVIKQFGWTINYTDPRQYDSYTLPRRIELTRPENDIRLRFFGLNWTLDDS
jgi:outer membrane lipoprotein LolB